MDALSAVSSPITDLVTQESKLDLFEEFLTDTTDVNLAIAQIPSLWGVSDMATYLGYRAMGLTSKQACMVMEADESLIDNWREEKPEFLEFERKHLPIIQRYAAKEIVRLGFIRNMALFVAKDQQIITKANYVGLDGLTNKEFAWLRSVRRHYTNQDLLAIEKVISPEDFKGDTIIQLSWGQPQEVIEGVEASYALSSPSD